MGCSKISPGCDRCYAINQAYRNWEMAKALPEDRRGRLAYYEGLTKQIGGNTNWTGKLVFVPEALEIPLKRKKPQTYFVNSMSDMFHERVGNDWLAQIFQVMKDTPQHTYQILTKRPDRMLDWMRGRSPLPNVWLGVTVENQKAADNRIPLLLKTPAAIRWLSVEPLLEKVTLTFSNYVDNWNDKNDPGCADIDWVVVGGESGAGARECRVEWIESVVSQCQSAKVPVFVKQLGANAIAPDGSRLKLGDRKGGNIEEFPANLQIRQFPGVNQ